MQKQEQVEPMAGSETPTESTIETMMEIAPPKPSKWLALLPIGFAMLSHVLFGLHSVFSRYLQRTVSEDQRLPSLSILVVGYLIVNALYTPRVAYLLYKHFKNSNSSIQKVDNETVLRWIQVFKSDFLLNGKLWIFIVVTCTRTVTNILSSKFTSAIFVQLFALLTVFLVPLFSWFIYRNANNQEKLSWQMFAALFVTIIGSVLIIIGGVNDNTDTVWYQFFYTFSINWQTLGLTNSDLIGIAMAIISATCLAGYMVVVKSLKSNTNASSVITGGENMFIFQNTLIALVLLIPSLVTEDWSVYARLSLANWGMFMLFIILVMLCANLISILCIQSIGATTVGSILSIRLVSAIVFSAIILHENLSTLWQLVGSILVLGSVSVFLFWQQRNMNKPVEPKPQIELPTKLEFVTVNDTQEKPNVLPIGTV